MNVWQRKEENVGDFYQKAAIHLNITVEISFNLAFV